MCDELKELMKEEFDKVREEKDREYAEIKKAYDTSQEKLLRVQEDQAKIISGMVKNLMASMELTAEQAMAALKIPDAYREKCIIK